MIFDQNWWFCFRGYIKIYAGKFLVLKLGLPFCLNPFPGLFIQIIKITWVEFTPPRCLDFLCCSLTSTDQDLHMLPFPCSLFLYVKKEHFSHATSASCVFFFCTDFQLFARFSLKRISIGYLQRILPFKPSLTCFVPNIDFFWSSLQFICHIYPLHSVYFSYTFQNWNILISCTSAKL